MGSSHSRYSRIQEDLDRSKPPPQLPPLSFTLRKLCTVCLEIDVEFPQNTPTSSCTHTIELCDLCLEGYISAKVQSGTVSLKCPSLECSAQMDVDEIQAGLAGKHREVFDRFCELKFRLELQNEAALVWCKAPGCGAAQIHLGGAGSPIVTCQECTARSCFTHDTVWHEGKTCKQFTKELKGSSNRRLETKKSETWINDNTKPCPGTECGRRIQKNHGCDHMTCRKPGGCGHEFCWECLAPYQPIREQGNQHHKKTCKYYA